jgi:hypothetical protein
MSNLTLPSVRFFKLSDKAMKMLIFYMITCGVMAMSTWLSGLQWSGADGVKEFLLLIFRDKPVILFGTILIFILGGLHMHVGKAYFDISYFENGIIWLSTSWVSFLVLWLAYDILPNRWELIGSCMGQFGLFIALYGRSL